MTTFTNFDLGSIFKRVDKDSDGEIDEFELQRALSNGTFIPFNPDTVKLMIKMFDRMGNGKIRFEEFGSLWKYVLDWQNTFQTFDRDRSGFIDVQELHMAFSAFGYRFNPHITNAMIKKFDRQQRGVLAFDDFIQCCVMIYTLTEKFKQLDQDRDGIIVINYEQFMHICLGTCSN